MFFLRAWLCYPCCPALAITCPTEHYNYSTSSSTSSVLEWMICSQSGHLSLIYCIQLFGRLWMLELCFAWLDASNLTADTESLNSIFPPVSGQDWIFKCCLVINFQPNGPEGNRQNKKYNTHTFCTVFNQREKASSCWEWCKAISLHFNLKLRQLKDGVNWCDWCAAIFSPFLTLHKRGAIIHAIRMTKPP